MILCVRVLYRPVRRRSASVEKRDAGVVGGSSPRDSTLIESPAALTPTPPVLELASSTTSSLLSPGLQSSLCAPPTDSTGSIWPWICLNLRRYAKPPLVRLQSDRPSAKLPSNLMFYRQFLRRTAWSCTEVSRPVTCPRCRCLRSPSTLFCLHEPPHSAASHVHHRWQSSILGRCVTDLEFSSR